MNFEKQSIFFLQLIPEKWYLCTKINVDSCFFINNAEKNGNCVESRSRVKFVHFLICLAFGEKNDDKVRIRRCHLCQIQHQVDLLGLMSADEYHHFWVMNYNGLTMVGKRGQPAFFTWQDPDPLTVRWASIAAKHNVHADWVFHSFGNFQVCKVCGSP